MILFLYFHPPYINKNEDINSIINKSMNNLSVINPDNIIAINPINADSEIKK